MDKLHDQYLGRFRIKGRVFAGEVTLKGAKSAVKLHSDKFFSIPKRDMQTIRGMSRTGERISVGDAIGAPVSGSAYYHGVQQHIMPLFPHYIAVGPRHLDFEKKEVAAITFSTTGTDNIFYDHGAFGSADVKNIKALMPAWAKRSLRKIRFSEVFYYVDRGPIVAVTTKAWHLEAFNGVGFTQGGVGGMKMENEARLHLKFPKPVTVADANVAIYELRTFLEFISQTRHCIRNVEIRHRRAKDDEGPITLYTSMAETEPGPETDYRDNMVAGGFDKKDFERVLKRWTESHATHRSARNRIATGLRSSSYTIDRLIAAANAFDLLPSNLYKAKKLPKSVTDALKAVKAQVKDLSEPHRGQILSSVNRIKGRTLRDKIEARFGSLPVKLRKRFPEMLSVIDHCVGVRNYFVHGSTPKLSDAAIERHHLILTSTLEAIFVLSELYACGWKPNKWLKNANSGQVRHYVRAYPELLLRLRGKIE